MLKVFNGLSIAASALSIFLLAVAAAKFGLAAPFKLVAALYEGFLTFALGWFEPHLKAIVVLLRERLGLDVTLQPMWKHVFVLVMVLFGAWAKAFAGLRDYVTMSLILAAGVLTALWIGMVVLDDPAGLGNPFLSNFYLAGLPVVALAVVFFLRGYGQLSIDLFAFYGFVVVASVVLGSTRIEDLPAPGILLLAFIVISFAGYFLLRGILRIMQRPTRDLPFWQAVMNNNNFRLGLSIIYVFLGASLFLIANAGLNFVSEISSSSDEIL